MDTYHMTEEPSYCACRTRFLDAVRRHDGVLRSYPHPLPGRDGEALYTDVAQIGNPQASKWLIVISGTHGVEGYYGSLCQTLFLNRLERSQLGEDTGLLFVHLINPWGTSWLRRVNEDNVDLNRNFVDFSQPLPHNLEYGRVAAVFNRQTPDVGERRRLWDERAQAIGEDSLKSQVQAGQHHDPEGIFFAGQQATWSNRTLNAIFDDLPPNCEQAICLDLHTGAGEFGHPMLMAITDHDYPGLKQARDLFGAWLYVIHTAMGNTSSTGVSASTDGYTSQALVARMQGRRFMQLVIECGTYTPHLLEHPIMDDHYLHLEGRDPRGRTEEGRAIKARLLEFFYPHDEHWREIAWTRTRQIFDKALNHLIAQPVGAEQAS